jgi:hypothetical protein
MQNKVAISMLFNDAIVKQKYRFTRFTPMSCNFCWDFLLLIDVNEWMSYECSDKRTYSQNIHNSSTHSHAPEEETRNSSKNRKYKRVQIYSSGIIQCDSCVCFCI